MKLSVYDEVVSTNEVVKAALREGKAEGLVVRARSQRSGYGRQGRAWESPQGGLYLSMLLRPDVAGSGLATLSLVMGLAVRAALAASVSPRYGDAIQLKWPNDIVFMDNACTRADEYRKLCGISLETCGGGVCVGVGVNVFAPAVPVPVLGRNVPVYLADLMTGPLESKSHTVSVAAMASSLPADKADAYREEVITSVQREVVAHCLVSYGRWREVGFEPSMAAFDTVSFLRNRPVRIEDALGDELVCGTARTVDARGRLLVETTDGVVPVSSGEAHVMVLP